MSIVFSNKESRRVKTLKGDLVGHPLWESMGGEERNS